MFLGKRVRDRDFGAWRCNCSLLNGDQRPRGGGFQATDPQKVDSAVL